jgi:hypothetical protein
MPNSRTFAAALLVAISIPFAASAEEVAPPTEPPPVEAVEPIAPPVRVGTDPVAHPATATTTTTTTSTGTTTTTTTTITPIIAPVPVAAPVAPVAPVQVAPVAPPAAAPVVAPTYESSCEMRGRANWRSRLKGKLSLGFSKGRLELEDETEGSHKSLIGRINGRRGWSLELEFARLSLDGGDKARTASGAVVKAFGQRKLAPYVIAGAGGGRLDRADGAEQHLRFAEVGAGLMLRKKRLSIGVDVRRGVRHVEDAGAEMDVVGRTVTEPGDDHRGERYVRGRILALVNF